MIIVIDGLDRSYKTTIAKRIANTFNFEYVHFPLNKEKIYKIMKSSKEPKIIANAFLDEMINYFLTNHHKNIIIDRFFYSTIVYQGLLYAETYNVKPERGVIEIYKLIPDELKSKVDLTLIFDVDFQNFVERGQPNRNTHKELDKTLETMVYERFKLMRYLYTEVLPKLFKNIIIVETSDRTPDDIYKQIKKIIPIDKKEIFIIPNTVVPQVLI